MADTKVMSSWLRSLKCSSRVCAHEKARDGRVFRIHVSHIDTIDQYRLVFKRDSMEPTTAGADHSGSSISNCAVSAFLPCFMMETLVGGEPAASFTCSYSILGAQEKQENSPLYATYLLMPETPAWGGCWGGGFASFVSIGQNVHLLPTHYLLRPWSAKLCSAQWRDGLSFPALYPFHRFHSITLSFIETLFWGNLLKN